MDADVDTPLVVRTLRRRHPRLSRGLDAWDALERSPKGVADAVMAVGHPLPPAPAVESLQGVLGERRAGPLVAAGRARYPLVPVGLSTGIYYIIYHGTRGTRVPGVIIYNIYIESQSSFKL